MIKVQWTKIKSNKKIIISETLTIWIFIWIIRNLDSVDTISQNIGVSV